MSTLDNSDLTVTVKRIPLLLYDFTINLPFHNIEIKTCNTVAVLVIDNVIALHVICMALSMCARAGNFPKVATNQIDPSVVEHTLSVPLPDTMDDSGPVWHDSYLWVLLVTVAALGVCVATLCRRSHGRPNWALYTATPMVVQATPVVVDAELASEDDHAGEDSPLFVIASVHSRD